jgi:hypothetical protein
MSCTSGEARIADAGVVGAGLMNDNLYATA